jgi:hypothetical protein
MKMLLVYALFSPALGFEVLTGGECSKYYIMGPGGYKDVMAHNDPNDPSMLGQSGQAADDTTWMANKDPPYPDGSPKACTPSAYSGITCSSAMETHSFMAIETCATLRFSFAASSQSTVFQMTNNDTFQACDFTGATEITAGGEFSNGDKYIEFPVDNAALDTELYFASQVGCTEGQKIAITVVETAGNSYTDGLNDGKNTIRIQHCDCDHKMNPEGGTEAYHIGFVEGCKSEMPDDLSCCNPDTECSSSTSSSSWYGPSGCKKTYLSKPYVKGGNCIRNSDQRYMIEVAKEVHTKCSGATGDEKTACDEWLKGYTCPWYRSYNMGAWVFNTDMDGTDRCHGAGECTGMKDPKYPGVPNVCTASRGCQDCYISSSIYHGRCSGFCSKLLSTPDKWTKASCTSGYYCADKATGAKCNATAVGLGLMECEEDKWIGEGCDGDATMYTPHCDMWFMATHCKEFTEGNLTEKIITSYASDENAQMMIGRDVTEETCRSSREVGAYSMYSGDTKKWDAWLSGETAGADETTAEPEESFTTAAAVGLMLAVLALK